MNKETQDEQVLNRERVAAMLNICTRTLDTIRKTDKTFPRPLRAFGHPHWRRSDVIRWIEDMDTRDDY